MPFKPDKQRSSARSVSHKISLSHLASSSIMRSRLRSVADRSLLILSQQLRNVCQRCKGTMRSKVCLPIVSQSRPSTSTALSQLKSMSSNLASSQAVYFNAESSTTDTEGIAATLVSKLSPSQCLDQLRTKRLKLK